MAEVEASGDTTATIDGHCVSMNQWKRTETDFSLVLDLLVRGGFVAKADVDRYIAKAKRTKFGKMMIREQK